VVKLLDFRLGEGVRWPRRGDSRPGEFPHDYLRRDRSRRGPGNGRLHEPGASPGQAVGQAHRL
jgi:hypothetical protein